MFRSIKNLAKKRKDYFNDKIKNDITTDSIIEEFLDKNFCKEKELLRREITVNVSGNTLIINCSNKSISNELTIKNRELLEMLKEKKIVLSRVIIK